MNDTDATVRIFYDRLAPYYALLYGDWEQALCEQGHALSRLLGNLGVGMSDPVLDASCGIGTQTLGLAQLGYRLTASDISQGAIDRLNYELRVRELVAATHVDDIRRLHQVHPATLAAILIG